MSDTKYWLWLSLALGSNSRKITAVLENFDSPEEIYNCMAEERFISIQGISKDDISSLMDKSTKKVDDIWETCKNKGIRLLTFSSPMYPENLANIYDPPYVLYVRCKERINLNNYLKIAVVGNRKMTPYGKETTTQLAGNFAKSGALVVSGMAEGIDGAAHEAALACGAPTVAVLGCGVDVAYPPFHDELMDKIIENGMVISEFPPGTKPLGSNFPIRNRIISGICEATVVVEAKVKSGSLITADCALEQGRDVYAVPGNINLATSEGPNNLIKQGAKIITSASDILNEYSMFFDNIDIQHAEEEDVVKLESYSVTTDSTTQASEEIFVESDTDFTKNLTPVEETLLKNLKMTPIHIDALCEATSLSINIVNSSLTILEMRGLVSSYPGKKFSLKV